MGAASAELIQIRMRLSGGRQVAVEARAAAGGIAEVGTAAEASNAQATRATRGIQSSISKTSNMASRLKTVGSGLTRYLSVPLAAVGVGAAALSIQFDKSMRNVNSIAQLPGPQFEKLKADVLDLAGKTAQTPHTLAEGLYDLVSSGFKANEAIGVLHASAKAATAGLTTTEVSTKAVAAVLNAYRLPASKAAAVSDDLFQTVNLGVVTFDELASSIGYVLPTASTLGVGLKEVGASISTLTKEGQSGQTAVTNINAALTSFIKPTTDMKAALKDLGFEDATKLIGKKGFLGAMQAVIGTTDGTKEAIGKLFPNVRAMRAVFGLTGKNIDSARADLKGFMDDTGATDKVLAEQRKSVAYHWNDFKARASAALIVVGDKLLPAILPVLTAVMNGIVALATAFGNLPGPIQSVLIVLGILVALAGPVLLFVGSLAGIAAALGITLGALVTGIAIVIAVIAVIGLVVAGFVLLYQKVHFFHVAVDAVWGFIKGHWPLLLIVFSPFIAAIVQIVKHFQQLKAVAAAVFNWLKGAAGSIAGAFGAVAGRIRTIFMGVVNAIIDAINWLIGAFNSVFDRDIDPPGPGPAFHGIHLDTIGHVGGGAPTSGVVSGKGMHRAVGGPIATSGYQWVGERGPELVELPAGARVKTAEMSRGVVRDSPKLRRAASEGKIFKQDTILVMSRDGKKIIAEATQQQANDAKARL